MMRNNKELFARVRELVEKARGKKLAIAFKSREGFEVFMDIVKSNIHDVMPLNHEHWDVYKYETAITIHSNNVMCYATVSFYEESIPVIEFDLNIHESKDEMHKEIAISKKKLQELLDVIILSGLDGCDSRGLIIDKKYYFDVIAKLVVVKGSWDTYKESTCIVSVEGQLVVANYEHLKESDTLFARFDPTKEGYINFDNIDTSKYDNELEKTLNKLEGVLDGIKDLKKNLKKPTPEFEEMMEEVIKESLNELIKDIGNYLVSDENSVEDKVSKMASFMGMIDLISNM